MYVEVTRVLHQCRLLATATSIPGQCIHRAMTPQKVSISFHSLPQNSENNRFRAKPVYYYSFIVVIVIFTTCSDTGQ